MYLNSFLVERTANFEELGHKGKSVDCLLVPFDRKDEFLKSSGFKCLVPMLATSKVLSAEEKIIYYV